MEKKWALGKPRPKVAIWTGPAWETWGHESYLKGGIGGSETCAIRLAQQFAENGCDVDLIGQHTRHSAEGVEYHDFNGFVPSVAYDLLISSRNMCGTGLAAKKKYVWIHDLFILDVRDQAIPKEHYDKVDGFIALSPWHKDFVVKYHSIPPEKVLVIPNGVNVELFR
jgi:glycosyltransferase involved in cell wall biosynthesis